MTRSELDQLIEEPYLYANLPRLRPYHTISQRLDIKAGVAWWRLYPPRHIVTIQDNLFDRGGNDGDGSPPSETILLLRKESGSTIEFVGRQKSAYPSRLPKRWQSWFMGMKILASKETQTELHTNLFKNDGAKESPTGSRWST